MKGDPKMFGIFGASIPIATSFGQFQHLFASRLPGIQTVNTWRLRCDSSLISRLNINNMGIFSWIILGLIAGAIAKYIHPGKDPGGWLATIGIGIVGAVVGGFITRAFGMNGASGLNLWSIIVAVLGAVVCLWAYRRFA
jgi:uncharacterized membrane protein YeaQ/YmgE (transglycosylase-associated protein family)